MIRRDYFCNMKYWVKFCRPENSVICQLYVNFIFVCTHMYVMSSFISRILIWSLYMITELHPWPFLNLKNNSNQVHGETIHWARKCNDREADFTVCVLCGSPGPRAQKTLWFSTSMLCWAATFHFWTRISTLQSSLWDPRRYVIGPASGGWEWSIEVERIGLE